MTAEPHWIEGESKYCDFCHEPGPTFESVMFEGEAVCESCRDYEDWWTSLTPEQKRADHEMADQYGDDHG